jgi:hypothetical protein
MLPQLAVDWDGVCVPNRYPEKPRVWVPGAVEALDKLACAAEVFVYTARMNSHGAMGAERVYLRSMLDDAGLDHIRVHDNRMGKPGVDLFIDDRALRFKNWQQALDDSVLLLGLPQ